MNYCIRCGSRLEEMRCPVCGWLLEGAGSGAPEPPVRRPSAAALPRPAAQTLGVRCSHAPFFSAIPPLVDIALHHEGACTYALSEVIGGAASSLGRWGDPGFESSAMLSVESPIGLELLADGSPIVIGGKGVVVNVMFAANTTEQPMPSTRGHRTGRDVSCFAIDPARAELALGVPSEGAVMRLQTGDFLEGALVGNLPGNPTALAYAADGATLGVGCYSGELIIVSGSGGRIQTLERPSSNEGVVAVAAAPGGGWVAAYEDGRLLFWDAEGHAVAEDVLQAEVSTLAVDRATGRIVAGHGLGRVVLWEPVLAERASDEEVHDDRVARTVPLLDRGMIVSAGRSGDVVVTNVV